MRQTLFPVLVLGSVVLVGAHGSQDQPPATVFQFQQIQPDIYIATGTGAMNVGSNAGIIVNDEDVVVVDTHITPKAARVLIRELKVITNKPVRFLINTHFHYDHTNGNQVFVQPVDIIGHEFTRAMLISPDLLKRGVFANRLAALQGEIESLKARAGAERDPEARARLEQEHRAQEAYAAALKEVRPTPPNLTMNSRMTIMRGGREIQILHVGRAHTGGDVVVYLPKERVLCTGDMVYSTVSFLGDAYVNEWPETLEHLKALDFENVIPGHGPPFKGKRRIEYFQAYLRDLWTQTTKLHSQGVPAEEGAKRIDMTAHKSAYPSITMPGVPLVAVTRMYDVIEGRAE